MKKTFFIFAILGILVYPFRSYADEPEKIETVIVTGIGIDADKAHVNAIRNAVEQTIGSFVSSDTMVKNSQLLRDEILFYSGGYVKDSHIVSQEKAEDGLFSVKLEAKVVSTKLKRKIETLNIAIKEVKGESLFGQALSRIEEKKSSATLLANIISKYPQAAYKCDIDKPEIGDSIGNKTKVVVPIAVKWDEAYLAELMQVFDQVAIKKFEMVELKSFVTGPNRDEKQGNYVVCFSHKNNTIEGLAEACYSIRKSEDLEQTRNNRSKSKQLPLNLDRFYSPAASLLVSYKNNEGKNVSSKLIPIASTYAEHDSFNRQYDGEYTHSPRGVGTLFRDSAKNNPDVLRLEGGAILLLVDGSFKINAEAELSINDIKQISQVEAQMKPLK